MNNTRNTKNNSNNSNIYLEQKAFFCGILLFILSFNPIYSQTYEEILRLRTEYEKLQKQELEGEAGIIKSNEVDLPTKIIYKPGDIESFYREQLNRLVTNIRDIEEISGYLDSTQSLKYYGYEFFTKRDTNQFWQNLPLPSDYKLGAGDELVISLWGEIERVDRKTVIRDGSIFIEDIGIIYLAGKTIDETESILRSRFEKTYATLKGNNAKSFMNVSLGALKGLNVHFYGAVKNPGVHALHPFSNIITGLIQAGGVDTTGSLRNIIVYRDDKMLSEFDLYDILTKGRNANDVKLINQDIIFVSNRISSISISGEVYRPGIFELRTEETMGMLINYAGGLKPDAIHEVTLKRIDGDNIHRSINHYQVPLDQMNSIVMEDGDSINVPQLQAFDKKVNISGHVINPGEYILTNSMRLSDLLLMAGGITDSLWWHNIDHSNTLISRQNKLGKRVSIKIDLLKMRGGDEEKNPLLKVFDHILIPKNQNYSFGRSVTLTGEIITPGIYNLNNNSLTQIISQAGGFTDQAFQDGIQVLRDTLSLGWNHLDFPLVDGDSIHVPIRTNTVKIVGAVNNEGYFPYKEGISLKKYIEMAGGFTVYANRKDVVVILPNGFANRKTRYRNPKVLEGATIIVSGNDLVVSQPNYLEMGSQLASIIGSMATVALIINSQK